MASPGSNSRSPRCTRHSAYELQGHDEGLTGIPAGELAHAPATLGREWPVPIDVEEVLAARLGAADEGLAGGMAMTLPRFLRRDAGSHEFTPRPPSIAGAVSAPGERLYRAVP